MRCGNSRVLERASWEAVLPTSRRTLGLLTTLYLAQGLPFGFFTQALPVLMREMGVSLEGIGLTSLLAAPWALKFLWAPLVERWSSRRRWLMSLVGAAAVVSAGVALVDPTTALWAVLVGVFLVNLVAATQDIATDGLAITLLPPEQRGLANGVQVAGYRVGMVIGGGFLLIAFDVIGWTATMLVMSGLLVVCVLPLLASPEVGAEPTGGGGSEGHPWSWLQLDGAWAWGGVLMSFKLGDYLVASMVRPWLVDLGVTKAEIGVLMGMGGFGAGLFGALMGGALVQPLGRRRALVWFSLLQASGLASYAVVAAVGGGMPLLWGAVLWEHWVGGMATAALFTAMMDASRLEEAGTDYTVQASIVVLASFVGSALSGFVAGAVGYEATFTLGACVALTAPVLASSPRLTRLAIPGG